MRNWVSAFRLRTLPLALSSIGMGSFLAAYNNAFKLSVFLLCCLTTIFLQVLSNLANDYGDSVHGADSPHRQGPIRAVQSGKISPASMKTAMILCGTLSFISGLLLLYLSFSMEELKALLLFLVLGIISITAAIKYTAGKNPYGYAGLGDISVFVFFGLVGVLGTYYLQAKEIHADLFLPAVSCGFFSVAVLNINNIRDIESDKLAGKKSIPVRIGGVKARLYHLSLLILGLLCGFIFVFSNYTSPLQFLFLLSLPLLCVNAWKVWSIRDSKAMDPYLKQMALTTLLFVLTFGLGLMLG